MRKQTLAEKIRKAAGLDQKIILAQHGRELSKLEALADSYLMLHNRRKSEWNLGARYVSMVARDREKLCSAFLAALETGNSHALRSLADLLDRPQFANSLGDTTPEGDRMRWLLLLLKGIQSYTGARYTAAFLAEALQFNGDHSRLRKLAKEVGLQLHRNRVGRPRKIQTPKRRFRPTKS